MTHDRNSGTPFAAVRPRWSLSLLALLLGSVGACVGTAAPVPSEWPPDDFRLQVEELREGPTGAVASRRFTVDHTGLCIYGRSSDPLVDPVTRTAVPVFKTICAYRLRDECTRLLARKLHRRGVLDLDPEQGDRRETQGVSLRLAYRAFGNEKVVIASGQIHGSLVRVLHVVNAYVPPAEVFTLPGMVGDPEPRTLTGVPPLADGILGALTFHESLLESRPGDPDLLLDAFALACVAPDRAAAERLLARWSAARSVGASPGAPFTDPPRLLPEILERMLPR